MSVNCVEASSEYLKTAASINILSGLSALTVSCWVKPTTLTSLSAILNCWWLAETTTKANQLLFRMNNTDLQGYMHNGTTQSGGNFGKTVSTGAWQHIAMTYDGSSLKGYLDGSVGAITYSPSGTIASEANDWCLGLNGTATYYDGLAEDRAVWNRALSADEIKSIYDARLRAGFFAKGLIQWWPLDVPGDGVYDAFVNGDFGGRDIGGSHPATLGTAPDWSSDTPNLHWPSKAQVCRIGADVGTVWSSLRAPYSLFQFDSANWTTNNFYLELMARAKIGSVQARLYNETDGVAVSGSIITIMNTAFQRKRSSGFSLTAGKEYRVQLGSDSTGIGQAYGARLVHT